MSSMTWMSSRLVVLPHHSHARCGAELSDHSALQRRGYPELLSHSVLWQPTVSGLWVYAELALSCNPLDRTSC
jgi:hypothetical protein